MTASCFGGLAGTCRARDLLLEQLVGISIETLSYDGIIAILPQFRSPATVLERAQKELGRRSDRNRQVIDLDGEKALWLDRIQRTFTDDGQGAAMRCRWDSSTRQEIGEALCSTYFGFTIRTAAKPWRWWNSTFSRHKDC